MNLDDVLQLSGEEDYAKNMADVQKVLCRMDSDKEERRDKAIEQHDELKHKILERPDKEVGSGTNKKTVPTAKLIIPVQNKIVEMAVAFLFGTPVKLSLQQFEKSQDESFKLLKQIWKRNKLDYHNKELARRVFVETRAAELFYIAVNPVTKEKRVRTMLLCQKNGDEIFPTFDSYGDMVAFTRRYKTLNSEGKEVVNVDIYYADKTVKAVQNGDEWEVEIEKSLLGKIPIIYYEQEKSEWSDVQSLIDRQEMLLSRNADTNDYFGSPSVKVKGNLVKGPDKDEIGKLFRLQGERNGDKMEYGDVEYMTWDRTPESIKLEYEVLKDTIYSSTSTPDLSFNNVKGTSNLSGIALKFMFMDAVLKSLNKQEIFGDGLDRRINLLKEMMALMNVGGKESVMAMEIDVEFKDAMPENLIETIEMLSNAVGGKPIMSTKTAVKINPMVKDSDAEIIELETEGKAENSILDSYPA